MKKLLGLPELASQHGADVDNFIVYVHWLMIALFVGWLIYFVYTLWRFRASRRAKADPVGARTHASNYIEGAVVVAEGILLIGFALPAWTRAVEAFPSEKEAVVIRVTGRQFNWMTRYPGPDGVFGKQDIKLVTNDNPLGLLAQAPATKGQDPAGQDDIVLATSEVVVPVDKPVILHISSLDVVHSFKVSPLRICQDAIPGMSVPIHFRATRTNSYMITCAQLCGQGHYSMKGSFRVVTQPEFEAWLQSQSKLNQPAVPVNYE